MALEKAAGGSEDTITKGNAVPDGILETQKCVPWTVLPVNGLDGDQSSWLKVVVSAAYIVPPKREALVPITLGASSPAS